MTKTDAQRVKDLRTSMSLISSFLGAGLGDDNTTDEDYEARIRWGINDLSRILQEQADTLRKRVEAAEEMATDLTITANNAQDAAKTDDRWEGVAEKLRARVAAFRETQP